MANPKWVNEAVGTVGEARKRMAEFLEWLREQGYTDEEIYQLVLIWLEPLGRRMIERMDPLWRGHGKLDV